MAFENLEVFYPDLRLAARKLLLSEMATLLNAANFEPITKECLEQAMELPKESVTKIMPRWVTPRLVWR